MSTPAIPGPILYFVRDGEYGFTGTLNRTVPPNTIGEASFHVPTQSIFVTDPQVIAGKVRIPAGHTGLTFQLQKLQFDIFAVNDPSIGGTRGVIPLPSERPDIWEVWPGTNAQVLKDFWFVDFLVEGELVLHTTRPGLVSTISPPALIEENSVFMVSRNWGGSPGQWTQISDLPNGTYEVQIRTNPAIIASYNLVFGLTKNDEDIVVLDKPPARRIVINVFTGPPV